jgi:ubiquinone/menaquinone biosynthesis C-methylase UbiE
VKLGKLKRHWDKMASTDAMRAIAGSPGKQKGRPWREEEFFETGVTEIEHSLAQIAAAGVNIKKGKALDFGSGIGRLTQALAPHFSQVVGVDVSTQMLQLAEQYNRYPSNCRYSQITSYDLRQFADGEFDFVYSNVVLQHIEPRYAKQYIAEFLRVLADGGTAMFMLHVGPPRDAIQRLKLMVPKSIANVYRLLKHRGVGWQEMFWIEKNEVIDLLKRAGATSVQTFPFESISGTSVAQWFVAVKQTKTQGAENRPEPATFDSRH